MPDVDEYFATLEPAQAELFKTMSDFVKQLAPLLEQGTSYAMPAFLYRGKPILSLIVRKKHLALYPFSGKVIDRLALELSEFSCTAGSIHFTQEHRIPELLLKQVVEARIQEIDAQLSCKA